MNIDKELLQIGNTIRIARAKWQVSKTKLANDSGVSLYKITKIERGESISVDSIIKISEALCLKLEVTSKAKWIASMDKFYKHMIIEKTPHKSKTKNITSLKGMIAAPDKPVSVESMKTTIKSKHKKRVGH